VDVDVIVAGGGPGGAVAASRLAQGGLDVLVLEKAHFPRQKACGGCLSPKVLSLGVEFGAVVEDVIEEAVFAAPGATAITYRSQTPLAYMVRRERLDQLLLKQAEQMGARVLYGYRVLQAQEIFGGVEVVSDRGTFRAPLLIGADGALGATARSFLRPPSRTALAMDARLLGAPGAHAAWRGKVLIDFGGIPFGYGWIFPTACDLSTGVLGTKKKIRRLPGYLDRFLERQGVERHPKKVAGWPIPYPAWTLRPAIGSRVLLVGDAAALADPLTGEGIYYAMQSGLIAARVIAEGGVGVARRYQQLIRDAFQPDLRGAAILAALVHRAPKVLFRALRKHPEAIEGFAAVLAGRLSYAAFLRKAARGVLAAGWRRLSQD
jgi:geranylgeranyl reductase family protein